MSDCPFTAIDHVQLAMPVNQEAAARKFYCEILGMEEMAKPLELAKRGGAWFVSGEVEIHLGVEKDFRAAKKAHPAMRCRDYELSLGKLRAAKVLVQEDDNIPGLRRCHIHDPFGNRLELIKS